NAALVFASRSPRRSVTRGNQSVATVAVGSMGPARVARRGAGTGASSGWWTAVLRLIAASTMSVLRAAHPKESTPPQSWPIVTIGCFGPVASVSVVVAEVTAASAL